MSEPGTRDLGFWNFQIEAPTTGDEFLLAKLGDTLAPVSFDRVATGGSGLGSVVVALAECDAGERRARGSAAPRR